MTDVNALSHSYNNDPDLIVSDYDCRDLITLIAREYRKLLESGLNIILCDDDPYPDYAAMREDYLKHHRLKVFTGGTSSPLLSDQLNVVFRAVHDAHHLQVDADFTLEGEIKVFQHVASLTHSHTLKKLFFSEIVLQAATFYATGTFPEQRIVDSPLMSHYLTRG